MTQEDNQLVEEIFSFSRHMKGKMSFQCNIVHLSLLQIEALVYIKKNNGCQMREIADQFTIEMPTATSLINKLCGMKLTKRVADKKDRRIVRIQLTEKGETLLEDAMRERTEKIRKMLSHLSEQDKKDLLRIVSSLVDTIEDEK